MANMQEVFKMFSEISKANPGAEVTLHPDGRITMFYRNQIEVAPVEGQEQEQEQVVVVEEQVAKQEEVPRRKWSRRKQDLEFTALSDEEKQTKLREETFAPIDVSQEGLEYLHSLGGNGRTSVRNVFINTMHHLTRKQRAHLQTCIRQFDLVKNKKVMNDIKNLVINS